MGSIGIHNTAYRVEISGRALLPAEQPEPPAPPANSPEAGRQHGPEVALVGSALTSGQTKHAQAFTTGAHAAGYLLDTLGIGFRRPRRRRIVQILRLFATLHEGGGDDPGTLLCTMLWRPSRFDQNAVSTFD